MPGQHPTEGEAEEVARKAVAMDSLLPGEEAAINSHHLSDARHWVAVYSELFGFKQALLGTLVKQRTQARSEARYEVQNDEVLLTREAERLSRRLEFWQRELQNRSRPPD